MLTPDVVVAFPLRGEWMAVNTPAEKVPSHGTDYFGQRYAYDFARSEPDQVKFLRPSLARQFFTTVDAAQFHAWNQPVHSAAEGEVIAVGEGWPDRTTINALWQLGRATFFLTDIEGTDFRPLAGNHVMVRGDGGVAFYAHLRHGSVAVRVGQQVKEGDILGRVGNSGNTTMPHLHFHVMDGGDPLKARGILCAFRGYERLENGNWIKESGGIPARLERIRS